jgi:hypothetical protein
MPTTWNKINKAAGTSWNKITKATTSSGAASNIVAGNPIGLLLALTYATGSNVPGGSGWTKVTKASGTSWTKITKPT